MKRMLGLASMIWTFTSHYDQRRGFLADERVWKAESMSAQFSEKDFVKRIKRSN